MEREGGREDHPAGHQMGPYLGVRLQVVVEHIDGDGEVPVVEGVRAVPALGPELAPLGHHGMEVAQGEEDALKLDFLGAHLQRVLREGTPEVRGVHTGAPGGPGPSLPAASPGGAGAWRIGVGPEATDCSALVCKAG